MKPTTNVILASGSPRRRHLMATFGIPFDVRTAAIQEASFPAESPSGMVERLALEKAEYVARTNEDALILGADTSVVLNGEVFGKPEDADAARSMLKKLSGKTHTVLTGVALVHHRTERVSTAVEKTNVTFDELTPGEIDAYVATSSPLDKAGGYGIQDDRGALFVSRIEGDFYNVMGLPLRRLYRMLKSDFSEYLDAGR